MCPITNCGELYGLDSLKPVEEYACICGNYGHWEMFQDAFVEPIERKWDPDGRARPRENQRRRIRSDFSREEFDARMRFHFILHGLSCGISKTKSKQNEKPLAIGSGTLKAMTELLEITQANYKSRGSSNLLAQKLVAAAGGPVTSSFSFPASALSYPQSTPNDEQVAQSRMIGSAARTNKERSQEPNRHGQKRYADVANRAEIVVASSPRSTTSTARVPSSIRDVRSPAPSSDVISSNMQRGDSIRHVTSPPPGSDYKSSTTKRRDSIGEHFRTQDKVSKKSEDSEEEWSDRSSTKRSLNTKRRDSVSERFKTQVRVSKTSQGSEEPRDFEGELSERDSEPTLARNRDDLRPMSQRLSVHQHDRQQSERRRSSVVMLLPRAGIDPDVLQHHRDEETFGSWDSVSEVTNDRGRFFRIVRSGDSDDLDPKDIRKLQEDSLKVARRREEVTKSNRRKR